jgi:molybdenum-dependent DNA-binding transcriptional regulator ModE
MGWVGMSERDLYRFGVLSEVICGARSLTSAAEMLEISPRQARRLLSRLREGGPGALVHRARGRPSNNRLAGDLRQRAMALISERYSDFGPTLAAEMLAAHHGLTVSRETLRHWMAEADLWRPRRQRRQFHPPRLRREHLGELVQIDGSEHRWFEDRAEPCTLLVFIDDATGRLMQLRFVASESAFAYFAALEGYLGDHGRPIAFYSDKHSVFRITRAEARHGQGMTQFGRALAELNIEILCANSSQAKGRVERVNRTLQDRLVKELRLAGISDIDAGNAHLPGFMERFNSQFAVVPARPADRHRPLEISPERLREILCHREQRHVGHQLTLCYQRKRIMLQETPLTRGLAGQYVDTYAFADGSLELRWQGTLLPYTAFDKDQRVQHAAIVENKRLGEALRYVQELQAALPAPRVKSNAEKSGYQRRGRASRRGQSFLEKRAGRADPAGP